MQYVWQNSGCQNGASGKMRACEDAGVAAGKMRYVAESAGRWVSNVIVRVRLTD